MPVDLRIDTDGRTEEKRIEVVGTDSPFSVETFGRPRRISIDPGNRVLTNNKDVKLRASILRGQGLIQQGDLAGALSEFNKALEVNKNSSLAHYRVAEVFYMQRNYQASANAYRESLNGDGEPRWTEVWSHCNWARFSTRPGSASAPSMNTGRPFRPTTIPRARSRNRASTCRKRNRSP
jgi:hypothetical protein